jgi:hypothetical protein
MAIPVLLTVGALGVGFVALSRERAKMPGANGTAPPVGGSGVATDTDGVGAAATSPGATVIGDGAIGGTVGGTLVTDPTPDAAAFATGSQECNTSTGGSDPSTQPSVLAAAEGLSASSAEAVPAETETYANPAQIYYGTATGVTRTQQSLALAEIGPLTGMVW